MNIPKKLEVRRFDSSKEVIKKLWEKSEEIIDYLHAKEEASNYKIVSFSPTGETIPAKTPKYREASKESDNPLDTLVESSYEATNWGWTTDDHIELCRKVNKLRKASKGECKECGAKYHVHNGDCSELYPHPPEHEEEWEKEFDNKFPAMEWFDIPNDLSPQEASLEVKAHIQANFVSKEKIKREIEKIRDGWVWSTDDPRYMAVKSLLNSLGLGD